MANVFIVDDFELILECRVASIYGTPTLSPHGIPDYQLQYPVFYSRYLLQSQNMFTVGLGHAHNM